MRPFSLLVKPASADCNLRCHYCFYLGKCQLYPDSTRHRMSDLVLRRMISSFLATEQPQHAFGWQGGEPTLMGLDFFKKVTAYQDEFGRPGMSVSNGLQTNGTLLDDAWCEHLARYNFLVGVSVDGPAKIHDHFRTFVDGHGAHADVMRGIQALRRNQVDFNILTLVSRSNVAHPRETYRYLCDMGVFFHQYIECVEYDATGKLKPFAITGEAWGNFLCGIYDEWIKADTRKVSVRLFDALLAKMVDGVENTCTMGRDCRQYLVVEHNGDIYPCDFFVEPEFKLGNITAVTWEELQASPLYESFGKRKAQWNEACDACEYLSFCAGCCQKNRPTRSKDPTRLSALCEGWKQFYAHALPGLRELADDVRRERMQAPQPYMAPPSPAAPPPKVGRNDPCPCGSGNKFKKCRGKPG